MKQLLSITAIFLMFFVGCSNNENNITDPTANFDHLGKDASTSSTLPIQFATTAKAIDGSVGGELEIQQNVLSSEGRIVEVHSLFEIPAGAFAGTQNITMTVNADNGCISFYPHMNFSQTCFLNYGLYNINLANLGFQKSDKRANFVYFNDSGTIDPITNMGVTIGYKTGSLTVNKAQLTHFSRYGFIRKEEE